MDRQTDNSSTGNRKRSLELTGVDFSKKKLFAFLLKYLSPFSNFRKQIFASLEKT